MFFAYLFFVSYMLIVSFIMLNLFSAIIFDGYESAQSDDKQTRYIEAIQLF